MPQRRYTALVARWCPLPVDSYIPYPPHSGSEWTSGELVSILTEDGVTVKHNGFYYHPAGDEIQFKIDEPIASIAQVEIRGKGCGFRPQPSPTYLWTLWLWNRSTGQWKWEPQLGGHSLSTPQSICVVRTDIGNVIEANGHLHLHSASPPISPQPSPPAGIGSINEHDYYEVIVTYGS